MQTSGGKEHQFALHAQASCTKGNIRRCDCTLQFLVHQQQDQQVLLQLSQLTLGRLLRVWTH